MKDDLAVLSKISMIRNDLTRKERSVADYVVENIAKLNNTKIEDLASLTQIGYSPIYSLLNKLGFKGYREFIIALSVEQKQMANNELHFDSEDDIMNYYVDVLSRNQVVIDDDLVGQTVVGILKARNIYVAGVGSTGLGAQEFVNKLARFGFSALALNRDEDSIKMQAALLHEEDVLIAFSLAGQNKAIIDAAKLAKSNCALVVGVSANRYTELFEFSNISHVLISSGMYQEGEVFISPILPVLYWIDRIIQKLLLQDASHQCIANRLKTNEVIGKKLK